eukprot:506606_1
MGAVHSKLIDQQYEANTKIYTSRVTVYDPPYALKSVAPSDKLLFADVPAKNYEEGGLWKAGIVPYEISGDVDAELRKMIFTAVRHWNQVITNVRFMRKSNTTILKKYMLNSQNKNYVEFVQINSRNPFSEFVGCQRKGRQLINVCFPTIPKSSIAVTEVDILHEMMHAIGFWHEHQRHDRDKHVLILFDETINTKKAGVSFEEEKYDIDSIMHYEHGAGGVYVLDETERAKAGKRTTFSTGDMDAINKLYKIESMKGLRLYLKPLYGAIEGEGKMGNFIFRTIFMGCSLLLVSLLGFTVYFEDLQRFGEFGHKLKIGYGLSGFAAIVIFLTSLVAILVAKFGITLQETTEQLLVIWSKKIKKLNPKYISKGICCGYIIDGLFQFMGGCGIAFAWNHSAKDIGFSPYASSIAGIFFIEQTFIGLHAIIAGLDYWSIVVSDNMVPILNDIQDRTILYIILYSFLALVDFFSFAVLSGQVESKKKSRMDNAGAALNALFYFLVIILMIYYTVITGFPNLYKNFGKYKKMIMSITGGTFVFCITMLLIGYFVFTANWVNFFHGTYFGAPYFTGIGFFVFSMGIAISLDIGSWTCFSAAGSN